MEQAIKFHWLKYQKAVYLTIFCFYDNVFKLIVPYIKQRAKKEKDMISFILYITGLLIICQVLYVRLVKDSKNIIFFLVISVFFFLASFIVHYVFGL